jgi:hypothetical protein
MNDHKSIMLKIEQGLHTLHGQQREGLGLPVDPTTAPVQHTEPVARVNFVASHSPAAEAVSFQERSLKDDLGSKEVKFVLLKCRNEYQVIWKL